jgi:CheY-like chemotaxis protein
MKSILVADDEYDIAVALEFLLTDEGYEVTSVSNGKDALTFISDRRPTLAILDVMMPFLTGPEVVKAMQSDPQLSQIPVVLMSAAPPKVKQEEYHWAAFVRKPFDVDEFLRVVISLIGPARS